MLPPLHPAPLQFSGLLQFRQRIRTLRGNTKIRSTVYAIGILEGVHKVARGVEAEDGADYCGITTA